MRRNHKGEARPVVEAAGLRMSVGYVSRQVASEAAQPVTPYGQVTVRLKFANASTPRDVYVETSQLSALVEVTVISPPVSPTMVATAEHAETFLLKVISQSPLAIKVAVTGPALLLEFTSVQVETVS